VGVVEITEAGTKFIQIGATKKLAFTALIGAGIGALVGWILGRKSTRV
jgi:membrane protein YqaA with SNARE-associated domain